MLNKSVSL